MLIIGGGPAGCTAATLLARMGRNVVLLEKDTHPRFHIGESLLPKNLAILDRLGVRAAVHEIGVFKRGAEFVSDETGQSIAFPFSLAISKGDAYSYQVRRADFDKILFDNAAAAGARCVEGMRVIGVEAGTQGRQYVSARDDRDGAVHEFAPRYLLDASGRDTFLANRVRNKQSNKQNNTAALYAHYTGVATRTGDTEGYISVHLADDGWFWLIPLQDGVMSIGFVGNPTAFRSRGGLSTNAMLTARIAASPTVSARVQGATRVSEVFSTGNYSYRVRRSWTSDSCMIGDSFAFVDPMFSSGVLMAMTAGEMGAATADAWLDNPARGNALAKRNERLLCAAIDRIGWLIYRINTPVMRAMFMSPNNKFRMRDGLVSLLAGNLQRDFRSVLPVMAFKSVYYAFSLLNRIRAGDKAGRKDLAPAAAATSTTWKL